MLKKTTDGARWLISLQQVQVAQHQRRALQDRHGKAQLQAHLQHPPRDLELFLGRLIVAGDDHVHRQPAQRPAQQFGGVLLDLDDVGKVVEGRRRGSSVFLAAIAELAAVLAAR